MNIFLGDLCGYYYGQLEIFAKLILIPNLIALLGNHDRIFLEILRGDKRLQENYRKKYGNSMDSLISRNHCALSDWLHMLPETHEDVDNRLRCYHGSPKEPLNGYVYPDSPVNFVKNLPVSILLLGHTHYKMHRVLNNKTIINPGSLGQPRDGGLPTYVVIDTATRTASFKDVAYDLNGLREEMIERRENNNYLVQVLARQIVD